MTTVSNRGLTLLILMTLALSVLTTIIAHQNIRGINEQLIGMGGATGFATNSQTGTAAINLSSSVSIALNVASLDWGTGIANQTNPSCTQVILNTSGSSLAQQNPNNCWTNGTNQNSAQVEYQDFAVENTGTTHVNLTINSSNSTNFFGFGSAASTDFAWHVKENESSSCTTGLHGGLNEFDDESSYQTVCDSFDYNNSMDALDIEIYLRFQRGEATSGVKTATVYFRAENATA